MLFSKSDVNCQNIISRNKKSHKSKNDCRATLYSIGLYTYISQLDSMVDSGRDYHMGGRGLNLFESYVHSIVIDNCTCIQYLIYLYSSILR